MEQTKLCRFCPRRFSCCSELRAGAAGCAPTRRGNGANLRQPISAHAVPARPAHWRRYLPEPAVIRLCAQCCELSANR